MSESIAVSEAIQLMLERESEKGEPSRWMAVLDEAWTEHGMAPFSYSDVFYADLHRDAVIDLVETARRGRDRAKLRSASASGSYGAPTGWRAGGSMPEPGRVLTRRTQPWRGCLDCLMAWLLYGDGAECLAGHGHVYENRASLSAGEEAS